MSEALILPNPRVYLEREAPREAPLDRVAGAMMSVVIARTTHGRAKRLARILEPVAQHATAMRMMTDIALANEARAMRATLRAHADWPDAAVAQTLALAAEAAARVLGLRPYEEQILGAYAAVRGMAAEMATGEGKTLAATLAAGVAGLGGVPVHVVTVNRYLAERDAEQMRPLYEFLGLSCGLVTEAVPLPLRAAEYRRDITVCTNKDVPFDYMRDRLAMGRARSNLRRKAARIAGGDIASSNGTKFAGPPGGGTLLRGLHFAIVDEADSVLIDEARTPLILSAELEDDRDPDVFRSALEIASGFRAGTHFTLYARERRVMLLEEGQRALASQSHRGTPWDGIAERERLVELALTAQHTLRRDEHYLVREGKAEIIDEFTGRVMPDRSWSDGLQEMVECNEGLTMTPPRMTISRTTYQRFYRRYRMLSGMSGTLREVAGELWRVYRLPVAAIPTHRPDRKRHSGPFGFAGEDSKWRAVAAHAGAAHAAGTPVLIGTRTVEASQRAAAALEAAGLPHVVLNAAQDATEAEIVARAGDSGAITVATNMAGRGTDIRLGGGVVDRGGLTVIVSEPHEARRIDRQLAGRCGRQGDPGSVAYFVSLEDPLLTWHAPALPRAIAARLPRGVRDLAIRVLARLAQIRAERLHGRMRRELSRLEEWLGDAIAFAGEQQ
jgi:preprotein translocase subunit SecA